MTRVPVITTLAWASVAVKDASRARASVAARSGRAFIRFTCLAGSFRGRSPLNDAAQWGEAAPGGGAAGYHS